MAAKKAVKKSRSKSSGAARSKTSQPRGSVNRSMEAPMSAAMERPMERSMESMNEKPNGPVSAALLAGGIGCAVLGIVTFAYEVNSQTAFAKSLAWVKPVGALSGKSSLGILAFLLAWVILHFAWRGKDTNFGRIATISFVLLAIGLLGTFPPVWHLFAAE